VFSWLQQALLLLFLAVAAGWDCRTGKIPNPLNLAGALLGLVMVLGRLRFGEAPEALLLGGAIAGGVMLLLYLGGGVGGGDVKLAIGFGLLSGYPDVIRYLFYGAIAALALILGRLAWRGEMIAALGKALRRKTGVASPGQAAREAARPERAGASTSMALALLLGVIWVWAMEAMG
jgi:Flp pilus assembly protein protease CpaA